MGQSPLATNLGSEEALYEEGGWGVMLCLGGRDFQSRSRPGVGVLGTGTREGDPRKEAESGVRGRCPVQLPLALREEGANVLGHGPDHRTLLLGRYCPPITQMIPLRPGEDKYLAQGHTDQQWWSQDCDPVLFNHKGCPLSTTPCGHCDPQAIGGWTISDDLLMISSSRNILSISAS